MLQRVLNNQDQDRQTTPTILDALTMRMANHEHTTQTILTRLEAQEMHQKQAHAHHEDRYNMMNDWGANITMQIHTMNTNIKTLATSQRTAPPDEELLTRLQQLETCYEKDATARQTAA